MVYEHVVGWESFEPWLSRVELMDAAKIWSYAEKIPPEWYGGDVAEMEKLVEQLLIRRLLVRELISAFRESDREPFPNWGKKLEEVRAVAFRETLGGIGVRVQ
jgi:hypothetical protein